MATCSKRRNGPPPEARLPEATPAGARRAPLSLRQRLFWWLVLPLLALVPAGSYGLYQVMLDTAVGWMDEGLADTALAIRSFVHQQDGGPVVEMSEQTERALRFDRMDRIYYVVLGPAGQVLQGDAPLARAVVAPAAGQLVFSDLQQDGEPLRLAVLGVECGAAQACQVRVAETVGKRDAMRRELLAAATLTMLVVAGVLALAGGLAIRQGLRPLGRLSEEVEQRGLDRLEPLDLRLPTELRPLGAAINRLFGRLHSAATAQQDFLANAAHQLRTPLTSLRTEIDLALLEPHEASVEPLLKRLQRSVDRSARLAQQMLSMARTDAAAPQARPRHVDLREIAVEAAQDWVPRAVEAGLDLGFELHPAPVIAQTYQLRELLENLIHNALSYAGEGARVTVRTGQQQGQALLEVEDTGPGIEPGERERVLQRFQRGAAARGNGSGLGLAIALDIARSHGGTLSLGPGAQGQGLCVSLRLPLAEAAG